MKVLVLFLLLFCNLANAKLPIITYRYEEMDTKDRKILYKLFCWKGSCDLTYLALKNKNNSFEECSVEYNELFEDRKGTVSGSVVTVPSGKVTGCSYSTTYVFTESNMTIVKSVPNKGGDCSFLKDSTRVIKSIPPKQKVEMGIEGCKAMKMSL